MAKIGELRTLIRQDFLTDGVISPAEAQRLVDEVKGGGDLTQAGREQLGKLLDEFSTEFSPAARNAVFGQLGLQDLPDVSDVQSDIATAIASNKTAITGAKSAIQSIGVEIDRIEGQNKAKLTEVDSLISQIESRKSEIKANQKRTRNMGLIGAMFGMPSVAMVSLVNIYDDDSRLRSLNSDLSRAKSSASELQSKASSYRDTKTRLTGKLETLQNAAVALEAEVQTSQPSSTGPLPAHQMRAMRSQAEVLSTRTKLLKNLENQVDILTNIRDEASGLGISIDAVLVDVEASAAKAKKSVEASKKGVLKMIEFFLAPNPETAAAKYLDKKISKMTNELLGEFKLKVGDYAASLAKSISPNDAAYAKKLTTWFTKQLSGQDAGAIPTPGVPANAEVAQLQRDLAAARTDGLAALDALTAAFAGTASQ